MNSLSRSHGFKSLWNRVNFGVGNLYTWGVFSLGCGIDQESQCDQLRPRKVDFFQNNVKKVYPGFNSTAVITDDGELYMFGDNSYGQLGIGSTINHHSPALVKYFKEKGLKVEDVVVGHFHTAAVASDGNIYTWGRSGKSLIDRVLGNTGALGDDLPSDQTVPYQVAKLRGGPQIQFISAGKEFTTVINANQEMYNWGNGEFGTMGNGASLKFSYPERNPIMDQLKKSGYHITKIKSTYHGTLALLNDGSLIGWGRSYYGCLGVREQEYVKTDFENYIPIPVNTKYFQPNEKVVDFDLGLNLSCLYTNQGRVYISGSDSTYVPRPVEAINPAQEKVIKVSASNNSFAVLTDKNFYVSNDYLRPIQHLDQATVFKADQKQLFGGGSLSDFGGNYFVRYAIVQN